MGLTTLEGVDSMHRSNSFAFATHAINTIVKLLGLKRIRKEKFIVKLYIY
jgi:hypothetical protein